MRSVVIGLGIQGKKRLAIAGKEAVATVDPVAPAKYRSIEQVPLNFYDAALVCTPDSPKIELIEYLLTHEKHVMVEKPLMAEDTEKLEELRHLVRRYEKVCYTAYNHRFEPNLVRMKENLKNLGKIYYADFFYGNGTARDVRNSVWRDQGAGVLPDLGSHLLDMVLFLFGTIENSFEIWNAKNFENKSWDSVVFGTAGTPSFRMEMTLLSWKNTFRADIVGEKGSLHMNGLCKWGPSTLAVRKRKLPSGKPDEKTFTEPMGDPTWKKEYAHFKKLCKNGDTNLENDIWINEVMNQLTAQLVKNR